MYKISFPPTNENILFETTLDPPSNVIDKLSENKNVGNGELIAGFGKKNKVAIGVPYYENLISRILEKKQEIPHEIRRMIVDYDFHFISLNCSFLPDNDCKIIWARFGVELLALAERTNTPLEKQPIAYDMIPDEITAKINYAREFNLSPDLHIEAGPIKTGVTAGKLNEKQEFIVYEPEIFAYGIGTPSLVWNFKSTTEKGIWGSKRNLILIVRTPKNSKLMGRFIIGAEVEATLGKLIKIPLTKREDQIANAEYELSS